MSVRTRHECEVVRGDDLVPWDVRPEHRWAYPLGLLRSEARRRAGSPGSATDEERLALWKAGLSEQGTVVAYDPYSDEGFSYVPRRVDVDADLIREPDREWDY